MSTTTRKPLTGTRIGLVTSDKRDKTRTVTVAFQQRHPKYGKYLRRSTSFQVHDPENLSQLGDRVEIANCRPVSKTKSWRLVQVVEKARAGAVVEADAPEASLDAGIPGATSSPVEGQE